MHTWLFGADGGAMNLSESYKKGDTQIRIINSYHNKMKTSQEL